MDNPVPTVFDLLGLDENDMTFAIPWGMAQSPAFLRDVAPEVTQTALDPDDAVINLQRHHELGGSPMWSCRSRQGAPDLRSQARLEPARSLAGEEGEQALRAGLGVRLEWKQVAVSLERLAQLSQVSLRVVDEQAALQGGRPAAASAGRARCPAGH